MKILAISLFIIFMFSLVAYAVYYIKRQQQQAQQEMERRRLNAERQRQFEELNTKALSYLGLRHWNVVTEINETVTVKSRTALNGYDDIKFFKENKDKLRYARSIIEKKRKYVAALQEFIKNNPFKEHPAYELAYDLLRQKISIIITSVGADYVISVQYISSTGNCLGTRNIAVSLTTIDRLEKDPSLLMSKSEYNQFVKEQQKEVLERKKRQAFDQINFIIDYANNNKDLLFLKGSKKQMDALIDQLFAKVIDRVQKIKTIDSEEWNVLYKICQQIKTDANRIVNQNKKILDYYNSQAFLNIKSLCDTLMNNQRDFNEYISEKVKTIEKLFGTRIIRNETVHDDEHQYIRPYQKTITPFTAEVSATVFASAENAPLEYIVKHFYPNKELYPEQIQKLHLLIEELETLKEAKEIIETQKNECQQQLQNVPSYVMDMDRTGFYARLGFAHIDEDTLTVEYQFSYTSCGGMAKRMFTVPMTENTIVELIRLLEEKLTIKSFSREQRALMTKKLREHIKQRDGFACCQCGNSTFVEPNLLLEIDHIIPVSKGGYTVENNLQTLCWRCNRAKGSKTLLCLP